MKERYLCTKEEKEKEEEKEEKEEGENSWMERHVH